MDLFQLREQFSTEGILMCFNGPFSHSIIEEMGTAIRNHLAAENITRMAVQDVFAVYIEMTQNVRNYLSSHNIRTDDIGSATVLISRQGERYAVSSGNVMLKEDVAALLARIERINACTPDELKKEIRRQLRSSTAEPGKGAGIGLMEMAKRSPAKLEYAVRDIDGRFAFFTLKTLV